MPLLLVLGHKTYHPRPSGCSGNTACKRRGLLGIPLPEILRRRHRSRSGDQVEGRLGAVSEARRAFDEHATHISLATKALRETLVPGRRQWLALWDEISREDIARGKAVDITSRGQTAKVKWTRFRNRATGTIVLGGGVPPIRSCQKKYGGRSPPQRRHQPSKVHRLRSRICQTVDCEKCPWRVVSLREHHQGIHNGRSLEQHDIKRVCYRTCSGKERHDLSELSPFLKTVEARIEQVE